MAPTGQFYRKERGDFAEAQLPVTTCGQDPSLGLSFLVGKIKVLGAGSSGSYIPGVFVNQECTILYLTKTSEMSLHMPAHSANRTRDSEIPE